MAIGQGVQEVDTNNPYAINKTNCECIFESCCFDKKALVICKKQTMTDAIKLTLRHINQEPTGTYTAVLIPADNKEALDKCETPANYKGPRFDGPNGLTVIPNLLCNDNPRSLTIYGGETTGEFKLMIRWSFGNLSGCHPCGLICVVDDAASSTEKWRYINENVEPSPIALKAFRDLKNNQNLRFLANLCGAGEDPGLTTDTIDGEFGIVNHGQVPPPEQRLAGDDSSRLIGDFQNACSRLQVWCIGSDLTYVWRPDCGPQNPQVKMGACVFPGGKNYAFVKESACGSRYELLGFRLYNVNPIPKNGNFQFTFWEYDRCLDVRWARRYSGTPNSVPSTNGIFPDDPGQLEAEVIDSHPGMSGGVEAGP
jgi:hypothetical protein